MPESNKVLVAAVLAALGYIAKLILHEFMAWRRRKARSLARLLRLSSLLNAAYVAFAIQSRNRDRLASIIKGSHPDEAHSPQGYDDLLSTMYDRFAPEEKELHAIIRGITTHALKPINDAMIEWLDSDVEFRVQKGARGERGELAAKLNALAGHLLLWRAKYETWIPNHPAHALVYLADEKEHGLGFPTGLEKVIDRVIESF